jgi:hypothetical protein
MPAPAGSRVRAWVATWNNPNGTLRPEDWDPAPKYVVWQLEKGENGTPHYQIYAEFGQPVSMQQVKKNIHDTAHLEKRKGTAKQARDYCMKEDTREDGPWEFGEYNEPQQGKRTDIEDLKDFILTGPPKTKNQIMDEFPGLYAKHTNFVEILINRRMVESIEKVELLEPYPWQSELKEILEDDPHPRQIYWVYDSVGNNGKSFFVRHMMTMFPDDTFFNTGGKTSDIAYAYNGQKYVFFDYAREKADSVNYQVMEQFKNGMMFSTKYNSIQKVFNIPHVVVMANFKPEQGKFSMDRLRLFQLGDNHTWDEVDF